MNCVAKILITLKIFDPDCTLSLSNLGMFVVIAKLATAATLDWPTMTAFFLALLNHNAKKAFRPKAAAL